MLTKENVKFYWIGAVVFGVLATLYILSLESPNSSDSFKSKQFDFVMQFIILNVVLCAGFLWQIKNKKFVLKKKLRFAVIIWVAILYQGLKFFAVALSFLDQIELVIATSVSLAALGLTYPHDKYFSDTIVEEDLASIEQALSVWTSVTGVRLLWYSCFGFLSFMTLVTIPILDLKEISIPMTSLHQAFYAFIFIVPILIVIFNYQVFKKRLFSDKARSTFACGVILALFSMVAAAGMGYALTNITFNLYIAYTCFIILNLLLVFPRQKDFGPSVPIKAILLGNRA